MSLIVLPIALLIIPLYYEIADGIEADESLLMYLSLILFVLSIFLGTCLWIITKIRTKIEVDEKGLLYKSLFKNLFVEWNEITDISREYLYEKKYPRKDLPPDTSPIHAEISDLFNKTLPQSELPFNLIIKTKKKNKLKIMHILRRIDELNNGIAEFENEIKLHGNLKIDAMTPEKIYIKDRKEWRTLLFVSIVLMGIGIIMSIINAGLISFAIVFFGIWLFLFYMLEYVTRSYK